MNYEQPQFLRKINVSRRLSVIYLLLIVFVLSVGCTQLNAVDAPNKNDFLLQRQALIEKFATDDKVFMALAAQVDPNDPESEHYWRWRTDQYLYGQYPEYQPIYDAYKKGKSFLDIYKMSEEDLGPKYQAPVALPEIPQGYFTENLPGNPHRGWHYVLGDTVYITYQGHLTDPYIASYNLLTHQWKGPFKAGESTLSKGDRKIDSHGRPIIEIDSKGHIHIVYGGHGGEREDGLNPLSIDTPHAGGRMLHLISKRPYDISEFEYVDDISPFASYTKSYKMGNGDIYLFTRAGTHKSPWVYYKMLAGKQRFEPPVIITVPTPQQHKPINVDTFYINPLKISDTDIAISYLWHECNFLEYHNKETYSRINAYYVRLNTNDDTFYNAQGEPITLPITIDTANEKMLAFDSTNKEETPFNTTPLLLSDNTPAVIYEARTKQYREHRMTAFNNGQWEHSLPLPGEAQRTLHDEQNNKISTLLKLETIDTSEQVQTAMVIYRDKNKHTVFAQATSENGDDWRVSRIHLSLEDARIQMEPVKDSLGQTIALIVNIRKGEAQRLYLWHDGAFRAPNAINSAAETQQVNVISESFENGGWNATSARGFTPGLLPALTPQFLFNQLQGDHAFVLENEIVRKGKHSAKLVWHHKKTATYNGDMKKIDNVDRKAMFHGFKTNKVMHAEAWYGFSFYFPTEGTADELNPWLFFQIHGSADKRLNEHSRNPPFSISMDENGLHGSWKWDPDEKSITRTGKGTQHYRIPGKKANYLDRWVDFVVHVKVDYSEAKTGLIELWVDGNKVLNKHNIQFGYNDDNGIYPSWGMYFNGDLSVMKHDHYLYLDEIKMTDSENARYQDVAPN